MSMSEAVLQKAVSDLAKWAGFLVYSIPDSRRATSAGYPDLTLCHTRTGRLIHVELKTDKGRISVEQHVWLRLLAMQGEAYVWREADWHSGTIRSVLAPERLAA